MSLEKINHIREHPDFTEGTFEAILITSPENIVYVLGFKVESDLIILVPREDSKKTDGKILIFSSALEYDELKKNIEADKELSSITEILRTPSGEPNFVEKELKKLNFDYIGYEDEYVLALGHEDHFIPVGVEEPVVQVECAVKRFVLLEGHVRKPYEYRGVVVGVAYARALLGHGGLQHLLGAHILGAAPLEVAHAYMVVLAPRAGEAAGHAADA